MIEDTFRWTEQDIDNLDSPNLFIIKHQAAARSGTWKSHEAKEANKGDVIAMFSSDLLLSIGVLCFHVEGGAVISWENSNIYLRNPTREEMIREARKATNRFMR